MKIYLIGGLGNNIFQVLATYENNSKIVYYDTLQKKNLFTKLKDWTIHDEAIFNLFDLNASKASNWNIVTEVSSLIISKYLKKRILKSKFYSSFSDKFDNKTNVISGYFHPITEADYLNFLKPSLELKLTKINQIGVHIRRGDIGKNDNLGLLRSASQNDCVRKLSDLYQLPIVVYTNDRRWCTENLSFDYQFSQVNTDENPVVNDFLGLCQSSILVCSNSTFSYTAAMLGINDRVFAPNPFFKREKIFTPSSWSMYGAEFI